MDKATIEAMRAVIDMHDKSVKHYERGRMAEISTGVGNLKVETLRLANEAFRTLVDQAEAEQPKDATADGGDALQYLRVLRDAATKASRSIGCKELNVTVDTARFDAAVRAIEAMLAEAAQQQAPAEPDERDVLTTFVEAMTIAKICAAKHGERVVTISAADYLDRMPLFKIGAVIRAINGLMDAKPTTTGEPTFEYFDERVAAMSRAGYLGGTDWTIAVSSRKAGMTLCVVDASLVGNWLIDRERAEAAKGGA